MKVLVTGSCGLIGSETVMFYSSRKHDVIGIDNNMRSYFFGSSADTTKIRNFLQTHFRKYKHHAFDIRDRKQVFQCFRDNQPDFIVHTAAQPSHDWAAREPFLDFEVNAMGTLNLLEAFRKHCPKAIFVFLSTNKVYGDKPNFLPMKENNLRYEFTGDLYSKGIDENLSIDKSLHSLFGASKLSADILCQEYGRYFGLKIGIFRGGCLTGGKHCGAELHGFLSHLINCAVHNKVYRIYGFNGKQVRDQIHSSDVVQAVELFRQNPKEGEVYNIGGGYQNSVSILEAVDLLKREFNLKLKTTYVDQSRKGDHICYYTNIQKLLKHYPEFKIKMDLRSIFSEMVEQAQHPNKVAA